MPELDPEFTDLFARFLVMDRLMLQAVAGIVDVQDFESKSHRIVIQLALQHWREFQEPISSFLRIEVVDYLEDRETRNKALRPDARADLLKLVNSILKKERPLQAAAKVQKMFQRFKTEQFMRRSMEEVLELQMTGTLTVDRFAGIAQQCAEFSVTSEFEVRDYTEQLDARIERRNNQKDNRYPLFLIDPLDERIRAPGRKELGLLIAPYKSGKSQGLLYISRSLAVQRYNSLHILGEDPIEVAEARLDAMLADLPISQIAELSTELQERFSRAVKKMRRRIRLVDAVGKSLTVDQIDSIYEQERSKGWTADATVMDYDEKLTPPRQLKEKRFEIDETYTAFQRYLGRRDQIGWTASQSGRKAEKKKVVGGGDIAEDIGKIRKATVAIGIGWGDNGDRNKFLYIAGHKDGQDRFGVDIMTNYAHGMFYDREATLRMATTQAQASVDVDD